MDSIKHKNLVIKPLNNFAWFFFLPSKFEHNCNIAVLIVLWYYIFFIKSNEGRNQNICKIRYGWICKYIIFKYLSTENVFCGN